MTGIRVVGAVLAGGRSSRMGMDKALVDVGQRPMASWVADALAAGGAGDVVLVGATESTASALDLPALADRWPGEGPLGGIATALLDHPGLPTGDAPEDQVVVVIAPCDQPGLTADVVAGLVSALAAAGPQVGCAVPVGPDGRRQPLPAAYRASAGRTVAGLLEAGQRRADAAIAQVGVVEVAVDQQAIADLDSPSDVARWDHDTATQRADVPGTGEARP